MEKSGLMTTDDNAILQNYEFRTTKQVDGLYITYSPQMPGFSEIAENAADSLEKLKEVVLLKVKGA
jgi:hypothetical protein